MTLTAGLGVGGGDLGRTTQLGIGAQVLMRSECSLEIKPRIVSDMIKKENKYELIEPRPKRESSDMNSRSDCDFGLR